LSSPGRKGLRNFGLYAIPFPYDIRAEMAMKEPNA
jgi:hypothetical protein